MQISDPNSLNHEILRDALSRHRQRINEDIIARAVSTLPFFERPTHFTAYVQKLDELWGAIASRPPGTVANHLYPYLKAAFLEDRLRLANDVDVQKSMTSNAELIERMDARLVPFDQETKKVWFGCKAARAPRLTEVLTLEKAEELTAGEKSLRPRKYDEKFHVLQAPDLFIPDLDFQRRKCGLRDVPLCVAFLDIDNFKITFNKEYGETHVDRHVLLPFMTGLEAHVFSQGAAYRFGGDEYAIIYPNVDRSLGTLLLYRFVDRLAGMSYIGVKEKLTVTIGIVEVSYDCPFTHREVLQKAEQAKNFGKEGEKGQVFGYLDDMMEKPAFLCREA
jgi:diguanylate cyclase (GGDEF)-like protein